jgi:hypothetical protein
MIPQYHSQTIDPKTINAQSSPYAPIAEKIYFGKTMMPMKLCGVNVFFFMEHTHK